MLQYQWHQLKKPSENVEVSPTENECEERKNVKVIMQRLFSTSVSNTKNNPYKGNQKSERNRYSLVKYNSPSNIISSDE